MLNEKKTWKEEKRKDERYPRHKINKEQNDTEEKEKSKMD